MRRCPVFQPVAIVCLLCVALTCAWQQPAAESSKVDLAEESPGDQQKTLDVSNFGVKVAQFRNDDEMKKTTNPTATAEQPAGGSKAREKLNLIECYMSDDASARQAREMGGASSDGTSRRPARSPMRLMAALLDPTAYDSRVRPTLNGHPTNITLRMALYQLTDVLEPQQTMSLYVWMEQSWLDPYLGWLPADYDNISVIELPHDQIWQPDTTLYNNVNMDLGSQESKTIVKVSTRLDVEGQAVGHVEMMYPAIYTFSCKFHVKWFPFDTQTCHMLFASWTHSKNEIDYWPSSAEISLTNYIVNDEWSVASFHWAREEIQYEEFNEPWVTLEATITIRRKPLFYLVNLVLPTAVITTVAVIGFFMPTTASGDRTEKVNLGLTTLLAMALLLMMVVDSIPRTSNFIPLMGWFYLMIIFLAAFGTVATSLIIWLQMHHRYRRPVWRVARKPCFYHLGPLLRVQVRPDLIKYWRRVGYTRYGIKQYESLPSFVPSPAVMQSSQHTQRSAGGQSERSQQTVLHSPLPQQQQQHEQVIVQDDDDILDEETNRVTPTWKVTGTMSPRSASPTLKTHAVYESRMTSSGTFSVKDLLTRATAAAGATDPQEEEEEPFIHEPTKRPIRTWSVRDEVADDDVEDLSQQEGVQAEWEYLADVMDRSLLLVFTSLVVFVTLGLMVVGTIQDDRGD